MKEEHDFSKVPHNYTLCLNRECSKAGTCLRQLVEQAVTDSTKYLVIINPKYQATLTGECPYYRSSAKVSFAKGFINLLDNLPTNQMRKVIPLLIGQFSRRTYYRIRKGERLLSPSEQKTVLNILKRCGITGKQEFDAYVEAYEW